MEVKCFCISLRASSISQQELNKINNRLDFTASERKAFFHTTLFQGLTTDFIGIIRLLKRSSGVIKDITIRKRLSEWNIKKKKIKSITSHSFNDELNAICLNYSECQILNELSQTIYRDLISQNLLIHSSNINNEQKNKVINNLNFNYAFNYQELIKAKSQIFHTTLGFLSIKKI